MRIGRRPVPRLVALLVCLLHLWGCTAWKPVEAGRLAELVRQGSAGQIRVTSRDGQVVEVDGPTVRPDSIVYAWGAIAMSDVVRLETLQFSASETLVLVAVVAAVPLLVIAVAWLQCNDRTCGAY